MGIHRRLGFVLVSVLWLIVLLSVIATALAVASRYSTRAVSGYVSGVQARYLADGAAQLVLANLLSINPADRMLGDGETVRIEMPGGFADVSVYDENGKVDINVAREPLLSRLFYSLDIDQRQADALADAIADYRDEDDLTRLNGAEDSDYVAAGLSWSSKNALFTSVEELKKVYGMDDDLYSKILPYVTIYSRQQGVNPEVAPLQVLMAVSDASPMTLESYVKQRRQSRLSGLPLPPPPNVQRQFLSGSRGVTYSLQSVGETMGGAHSGTTSVVRLRRAGNRMVIETLDWRPYVNSIVTEPNARGRLPGENNKEFH